MEEFGFGMNAQSASVRHQLIAPVGLRLVEPVLVGWELPEGSKHEQPVYDLTEGETSLAWDGWELKEAGPASDFLWEFVSMAGAQATDWLSFVQRWGLLGAEDEEDLGPEEPDWRSLDEFDEASESIVAFLVLLVATNEGELLPEEVLEGFAGVDDILDVEERQDRLKAHGELLADQSSTSAQDQTSAIRNEVRTNRWRRMRRNGRGLDLQRDLITRILNQILESRPASYFWDGEGRRLERMAVGVIEIAWSQLASRFTSTSVDIYGCSVCGRPFPFDPESSERRPRSGARALCGDECRQQAKRESNRQSWQKNKSKWRPPRGTRKDDKDGETG